jgi:hypothetical protein
MDKFQQVPPGITNVPRWEEHCRKIHARAKDLIDGKVGVIQAAEALHRLAIWTRAEADPDFSVYRKICGEIVGLPVGRERQHWSKEGLEREDPKIKALEERWRPAALASAHRLVDRYRWALAARQCRRSIGHAV